jgi:hypothetical protein
VKYVISLHVVNANSSEQLHNFYFLPNVIIMISLMRLSWTELIVYMGREEMQAGFWWEVERKEKTRKT